MTNRDRDRLAAALGALKGLFVQPIESRPPVLAADRDRGTREPDEAAADAGGLVLGPAVRASPGTAPAPEHGSSPTSPFAMAAVEPGLSAASTADGPHCAAAAPAPPPAPDGSAHASRPRPVVAVFGLAPGCGASTVARALAVELAARDSAGAAAVRCEPGRARASAPSAPAWLSSATAPSRSAVGRLAATVADFPGARVRTAGRLCLIEGADRAGLAEGAPHLAPLVLDEGSAAVGGVAAAVADRSVLVTTPALEPALAAVAAECIARVAIDPILVVNRVPDADATATGQLGHAGGFDAPRLADAILLPQARLAARIALRGKEARGKLQGAIARLADRCRA